jgi:two-component system phosphate regulon sensor histidine kinase PhoR
MTPRPLGPRLFGYFLGLAALCLLALAAHSAWIAARLHGEDLEIRLESVARLTDHLAGPALKDGREDLVRLAAADGARLSGCRITILDGNGRVLADSDQDPATMDNHQHRPEIQQARAGRTGRARRFSATRNQEMLYVAIPATGASQAVVRAAYPQRLAEDILWRFRGRLLAAALALLAAAAALGLLAARRLSRPLVTLRAVAERFAGGDFSERVPRLPVAELDAVGASLNRMARDLDARIRSNLKLLGEQKAVLAGMAEGVLVVDPGGRLLDLNAAAARLLRLEPDRARGRAILEAIRNLTLQRFVTRTLESEGLVEDQLTLQEETGEQHLQMHGTSLRDPKAGRVGAVIVLNDVTRLRRLEMVRREFVAHVSHELKTPVTAITGCAETLLGPGVDDPSDRARFLDIILRQSSRLASIIEDLLELARIESLEDQGPVERPCQSVRNVLLAAVQACEARAESRCIRLLVDAPDDLSAPLHAALLERAVVNLLDNAIAYSPEGETVRITANQDRDAVLIAVHDRGCGIEAVHLPHLFERFYRVDKSRSRKLGGTGLGLSIVKHIVQLHGGEVTVVSTPGKGSTFTIRLPLHPSPSNPGDLPP